VLHSEKVTMAQEQMVVDSIVITVEDTNVENLQKPCAIPTADTKTVPAESTHTEKQCFNEECVICFDIIEEVLKGGGEAVQFDCNHQLCYNCAHKYARTLLTAGVDITCPVCRSVLMNSQTEHYKHLQRMYLIANRFVLMQPNTVSSNTLTQTTATANNNRRTRNQVDICRNLMACLPCAIILGLMITIGMLYSNGIMMNSKN